MHTVSWRSDSAFTNFYLKDLGLGLVHGKYALAILTDPKKDKQHSCFLQMCQLLLILTLLYNGHYRSFIVM